MNIKQKLIEAGVKNLKEFGYIYCTPENIMTDEIYSQFFRSMLKDNLGLGVDKEINDILSELPI